MASVDAGVPYSHVLPCHAAAAPNRRHSPRPPTVCVAQGAVQKDAVITVVAAAAKNIPDGPPPPELFSLMHPSAQESAMQMCVRGWVDGVVSRTALTCTLCRWLVARAVARSDIIKHTAQYTAVSGSDFLKGLAGREHRNPQFDFLKHTHAYFGYFTALVESYSKVREAVHAACASLVLCPFVVVVTLTPRLGACAHPQILTKNPVVFARLKADALSTDHILRRCVHRMTFQRKEEERRKAEVRRHVCRRRALPALAPPRVCSLLAPTGRALFARAARGG